MVFSKKIIISLIIITLIVLFIFNTPSFCSSEIMPFQKDQWTFFGDQIRPTSSERMFLQYRVTPGKTYTFYLNQAYDPCIVGSSSKVIEPFDNVTVLARLYSNTQYTFEVPEGVTVVGIVIPLLNVDSSIVKLMTDDDITGMSNAISQLPGVDNLWSIFNISIPFVLVVVLVVFGFYIIRRILKKIVRGKGGL